MPPPDSLDTFLAQARADPEGTLIALDVDGTVSEIAPTPDAARVDDETRATLERCAGRYRVWFVSGRDADQARAIVGVADAGYVGAHGLEALDADGLRPLAPLADLHGELDALAAAVARDVPEVAPHIERKHWSVAFHYRAAPQIAERLRESLASHLGPSLRLRPGKMVLEAIPAVEHDKGSALTWLVERFAPRRVLVAGDDRTDVATFRALAGLRERGRVESLALAVLQPGETPDEVVAAADATVDGVAGLRDTLRRLLDRPEGG